VFPSAGVVPLRDNTRVWRILFLCCLALPGFSDDRWTQFQSGPFELWTNAGVRAGREAIVRFEQFRNALGQVVGDPNLQSAQPIRVLLFRNARELSAWRSQAPLIPGRDRYAILLAAGAPVPPPVFRESTRLLLEANTARMPAAIESGLAALFSTLDVSGIKTTLGRPVPPESRNRDWARVHLLATDPDYYGKLRVLIYNLRRGVEPEAAFRNAVAKSPAEIEKQVDQYLAAGHFGTVEISSRPMSVEHDFPEKPVEPADLRLALADLLLGEPSRAAYQSLIQDKLHVAECWEGLGLLALRSGQKDAARTHFAKAMDAGAPGAGVYVQYALLEPDSGKSRAALEKAVQLNAKLAEPHFLIAQRESDLDKRIEQLKTAVSLEARHADWWQLLAESYLQEHNYPEAAKAWRGAEQASTDDAQRARMRQARVAIEQQRLDYEAAELRRKQQEEAREIEKLKTEARAQVRALEARMNQGARAQPAEKVVPWWDGPKPAGHASGNLKQVDCLGKQIRLVVESDDHKTTRLLVPNPSQLAVIGGGERTLACGPQKPRRVSVEYFPKTDSKSATVGEVATIEFQ
jgi:hypothetical protein